MSRSPTIDSEYLDLLAKHLPFYQSLLFGQRTPKSLAQVRFVKVARGELKPSTPHELAFVIYLKDSDTISALLQERLGRKVPARGQLTKSKKRTLRIRASKALIPKKELLSRRLVSTARGIDTPNKPKHRPQDEPLEPGKFRVGGQGIKSPTPLRKNPAAKYIHEPGGSREAWRRDTAANWSNARKNKLV